MTQRNKIETSSSPCLVLAHPDPRSQALMARALRRLHWDVYLARGGPEARRLARMLEADVVILHAELPEESGWLTCEKLTRELPLTRVVLVNDNVSLRNREFASFVGASSLVRQDESLPLLIEELVGSAAQAAS